MDFVIEYGEYRPRVRNHPPVEEQGDDDDREYISTCLGEPFKHLTKIIAELYEDVVLIFNNMFIQEEELISRPNSPELGQSESITVEQTAPQRTPSPVVDLKDMPEASIGNREQYIALINYLQTKIIGMEITRAEQEINMVNPRVKLYTEMYNDVQNVSIYVTIDDRGRITSIDQDGKIIAEFCVE